jgi:ribonuclease P protein component
MTKYGFPKRLRLLRPSDFERVFAARNSAADAVLLVHGVANELDHARLGLAVSRKVGGAVVRNRWKRALREAFRLSQHELPAADIICIPRAAAVPSSTDLTASFLGLVKRVQRRLAKKIADDPQ